MPANKPRATPATGRPEPDLTDVPMTPMMQAMRQVGAAVVDLKAATAILDTLVTDASEGAWAEGHQVGHMLRVQGRRFTDRTAFASRLARRGIDTGESWRNRTSGPIAEQPVPEYLADPQLARIADLARELVEAFSEAEIEDKRDEQYLDFHKRSLRAINARMPGLAR